MTEKNGWTQSVLPLGPFGALAQMPNGNPPPWLVALAWVLVAWMFTAWPIAWAMVNLFGKDHHVSQVPDPPAAVPAASDVLELESPARPALTGPGSVRRAPVLGACDAGLVVVDAVIDRVDRLDDAVERLGRGVDLLAEPGDRSGDAPRDGRDHASDREHQPPGSISLGESKSFVHALSGAGFDSGAEERARNL